MPIITTAETKTLLQITASTYDTLIGTLIPYVQDKIVNYCNNSFLDCEVQLEAITIAFVSGSPACTITDSDSGFVDAYFNAGDYKIRGSKDNDKIVNVATVAAGTLTLATTETLNTETAGNLITLTKVKFPQELKVDVANLINHYITKQGKLVTSESLPGGYSVTYKTESDAYKPFNLYRKMFK